MMFLILSAIKRVTGRAQLGLTWTSTVHTEKLIADFWDSKPESYDNLANEQDNVHIAVNLRR